MTNQPWATDRGYRIVLAAVLQRLITRQEQRRRAGALAPDLAKEKDCLYDRAYWDGVNTTYRDIIDDLEDLLVSYRPLDTLAVWLNLPDEIWDIEDQLARETAIIAFLQGRR